MVSHCCSSADATGGPPAGPRHQNIAQTNDAVTQCDFLLRKIGFVKSNSSPSESASAFNASGLKFCFLKTKFANPPESQAFAKPQLKLLQRQLKSTERIPRQHISCSSASQTLKLLELEKNQNDK